MHIQLNDEWTRLMHAYREDHQHPMNQLCHTVGIPLIAGSLPVGATYTVKLVPSDKSGELTFQMDRSRHHDIDDVYGYFKVERFDDKRSVVTVAAAVDVGSDFTNLLFGKRVQEVILSTPYAMRDYFARTEPASSPTGPVAVR